MIRDWIQHHLPAFELVDASENFLSFRLDRIMIGRRMASAIAAILLITSNAAFAAVFVPESAECYVFRGVVVDGETGEPAPDVEFIWQDRDGEQFDVWLDDEGCFQALMGMPLGWWSAAYARRGDQVSQLVSMVRLGDREAAMELGPAAVLSGRVLDEAGNAVAGAIVGVAPSLTDGIGLFDGVSDENGFYQIEGVAPGAYNVVLEHPEYFSTLKTQWPDAHVELAAGGAMEFNVPVKKRNRVLVSGIVLDPDGKPAAGVAISTASAYSRPVSSTDAEGRFSFHATVDKKQGATFSFERAPLGRATLNIGRDVIGGETYTVRLPGTARFTGRITGSGGELVAFAGVEGRRADGMGNFDTGWISLPENGGEVTLHAGSQATWEEVLKPLHDSGRESADSPAYHPTEIQVLAKHGEEHAVNIQLEPIPCWVARGMVRDQAGNPVADAVVAVYEGDVNAHQWLDEVATAIPAPRERYPWRPRQSTVPGTPPARRLARVRSGADGSWEAKILRKPNDRTDWAGRRPDPHRLSVAAADPSLALAAVARFDAPNLPPDSFEANMELCPLEDELVGYVLVAGPDGQPLADASWSVNGFGPFVSDALGKLRAPRFSGALELEILSPGLRIKDAQFHGDYAMPASPRSDIKRKDKSVDYDADLTMGWARTRSPEGLHANPELPNLCCGERTLSFRYFDPTRASVHVTLEPESK